MPPAVFDYTVVARASPSTVWNRLQRPETWAEVAQVDATSDHRFDGDDLTGFLFTTNIAGVGYAGTAEVTRSDEEAAMTLSINSRELTGQILVELERTSPTTTISVRMTMQPAGLVGGMVFPIVNAAVQSNFPASVERFASALSR